MFMVVSSPMRQTQHTLRALEVAGRPDIPVVAGAEFPLVLD